VSNKGGHRHTYYSCGVKVQRGQPVCTGFTPLPMKEIDTRVLSAFEGQRGGTGGLAHAAS